MSAPTNETITEETNKKKRKYDMLKEESDIPDNINSTTVEKKKKKKKRKKDSSIFPNDETSNKYLHYQNTKKYTIVVAHPESLPPTPQIFQQSQFKNTCDTFDNLSLFSKISWDIVSGNFNHRFNHLALIRQNLRDWIQPKTREKLNSTSHDDSNQSKQRDDDSKQRDNKRNKKHKITNSSNENNSDVDEENVLNQVSTYKVKKNKGLIFHMHHKSSFSFHGEIKITVLSGGIEVLGYTVTHSSSKNSVNVYSPNFFTELVIETKPVKENKLKTKMESDLKGYLSEKDLKRILDDFNSDDTVLLIEQINSVFGKVINKYWEKPILPKDLVDVSSECETQKIAQSVFDFKMSKKSKHFRKNPQWDIIPLGSCTVLCGGKGVGKSTLLKYYINKLLAQGEKILCLDFDVGQPEFTCSGCVSAVVVEKPLLGPNFTHIKDPALMVYFGDVDVAQNPSRYLECVKHVIESCKKNSEFFRMKWFVNTMGFSKGLGVHLMITIIKLLQPNTVIQIQGKNNYPFFLTATNLNSRAGFKSMPLENVQLFHDLRIFKSYARKNEALKPRQLRDILSLSYFSKMVSPPYYNFNAVQPYVISFSQIYLGIHSLIEFNDILKAFNANIVSLLNFKPSSEEIHSVESEEKNYFKIVVKPKVTPCLGLGLVRGIDSSEKKFYIMTHLSVETLNKVNCFCLEKISPPHSMFLNQDTVEGQSVYITVGNVNIIQRVKRMFHGSTAPQSKE